MTPKELPVVFQSEEANSIKKTCLLLYISSKDRILLLFPNEKEFHTFHSVETLVHQ